MDKSFDFGALLKSKQQDKKHKTKPTQFTSVAGGVKKRLENNLKLSKSNRLTALDRIRNLSHSSRSTSPVPISEAQQKVEHRRQQLEKWKAEKEKKKKEAATQKKKPFLTGVPHNPLKFVPPPPPPKAVPSTSRRGPVTRSQYAKHKKEAKEPKETQSHSFAPKNAAFHAPQINNLIKIPKLAPIKTRKDIKSSTVTFEPVLPKARTEVKPTRSKTFTKLMPDTEITRNTTSETRAKGKIAKPIPRAPPLYLQSSSSENESQTLTSSSSSDVDLTANILSSNSDNEVTKVLSSSTENEYKSLQSSSSSELETDKQSTIPIKTKKSFNANTSQASNPKKTPQKLITPCKVPYVVIENDLMLFTPKNTVPKSESSSEERLRSPKSTMTQEQIAEEAKKISPCVTLSRGKANARKEMKKKLEEGLLDEDACDMDCIDYFRRQLASEIKRITKMCETWDKVYEQVALPESIQELALGAVGQARLLVSQKLQQFSSLVERCARPEPGAALVTPADLHGFWDMVFMQVENVDMRFKKLEELKARNWTEEPPAGAPALHKRKAAKPADKLAAKPGDKLAAKPGDKLVAKPGDKQKMAAGPSRLREMIAAARKAKKEEQPAASAAGDNKTFEAGFFSVHSPVRSPRLAASPGSPGSPGSARRTLLKAVLSSEAKKASASKNRASFAMLRASVLGRGVECEGVAPLPQTPLQPLNPYATPGRSILKQPQDKTSKSTGKTIKVVLFDKSDPEINFNTSTDDLLQQNINTDSGLSSMDVERNSVQKDKENSRRMPKLIRQDAVELDDRPIMTRSRRKSMQTPQADKNTPKRSGRKKKILEEVENNVVEKVTPRRSTRSRRSRLQVAE